MADRWRRRRRRRGALQRHDDDLPKTGLFTEPVRVTRLEALEPERIDAATPTVRVTFLIEVKDAEDRRCSDLAVDARMTGPDRQGQVQGATDLFGRVKVQMTGPPGAYRIEVLEVAAKALAFDRAVGPLTADVEVAAE